MLLPGLWPGDTGFNSNPRRSSASAIADSERPAASMTRETTSPRLRVSPADRPEARAPQREAKSGLPSLWSKTSPHSSELTAEGPVLKGGEYGVEFL